MHAGNYSLCLATPSADGAAVTYCTLATGYGTASAAFGDRVRVAAVAGVPAEDCAVIREVDVMEAELFCH